MKILLVTQYFYPENFKSNDIAFELTKKGYDVTVLTGIPNYPKGKYYKGYGIFKKRRELINGVKIKRIFLTPRGKGKGIGLALNYFSWTFFASIYTIYLSFIYRFDAIIVHETSPVTQGIPAVIVKKIQKIPLYFWVLDLWPESLTAAGGISNNIILSFFNKLVKWLYNNSDKILISSKGFEKSILLKGDYKNKIIYFPNWAENIFNDKQIEDIPILPHGFLIMFAGNIGEAQDFENIVKAALELKEEKDIKFIIVGDGRKKDWVDNYIKENDLVETVYLLGSYPLELMPSFFLRADAMLLTLKNEMIFNLTVPAKLQTYLAMGKPILGMLSGEGAAIIEESGCGYYAEAGDYKGLVKNIRILTTLPTEELKSLGEKAYLYFENNFKLEKCMDHLCHILQNRDK